MKTSFRQFVADMNRKHNFRRRLLSVLCILSLLVSGGVSMLLMVPGMTASLDPLPDNGIIELLTDNPTHNGWINYFGVHDNSYSTEFAGGVWMDKSVFTEYTSTKGAHITAKNGNMLGVLSAIGSSQAITGRIYSPTDVMLILDMSSSMYRLDGKNQPATVRAMVDAVNNSIATLLSLNSENRVGVTVYYGSGDVTVQSKASHAYVLLPLNRYKPAGGTYLTTHVNGSGELTSVKVTAGVTTEDGSAVGGTTGHTVPDVAGTYAQAGILQALKQFMDVPEEDLTVDMMGQKIDRQPIFIFMSDGEPTAATVNFTNRNANAQFGNNQVKSRSPNETDFVTQLTASYAKEQVGSHYYKDPLFYTLALGNSISLSVMDPRNNTTDTINSYWNSLVNNGSVTFVCKGVYQPDWSKKDLTFTVNKSGSFPSSVTQRLYVDKYYNASNANGLANAFETIVNEIILKSIYTPTLTGLNSVNQSGEVSFIDHIGQYMTVTDVKGILLGGQLYTGAAFSEHLTPECTHLGTLGNATELGLAFWDNVMEQIGLDHVYDTVGPNGEETGINVPAVMETQALIQAAYDAGQLSYNKEDGSFSHYIGWYADSKDGYMGFWDGTAAYDQTKIDAGATQVIKSYFFQMEIKDEDFHTMGTDMMYATVWVKEDIATGEETVVFSVPASLLPTLKYFVKLDPSGNLESLYLGAVDHDAYENIRPIRLVYEVGLDPAINKENLLDQVDATYLQNNRDPETGKVYFYSNAWERDLSTGYNKVNTYVYFRPSTVNDRYYYTVDSPLYRKVGENLYEPYTGTKPTADMELYTQHERYWKDLDNTDPEYKGVKDYFYMPTSSTAIDKATQSGAQWYIPAGTVHNLDVSGVNRFATYKTSDLNYYPEGDSNWQNITGTLEIVNEPYADDGSSGDITAAGYVMGATLGNNGRIALVPDGQLLQKKLVKLDALGNLVPYEAQTDQSFQFLVHEGEALTGVDYGDPEAVAAALAGKKVSLITLTVTKGNSETGVHPLTNLTEYTVLGGKWEAKSGETPLWSCLYTHTYTVVELSTNGRFDLNVLGETKKPDGSAAPDETQMISQGGAVYQFVYCTYPEGDSDHIIVASNQFAPWKIQLTKIDSERLGQTLPGAIFGIYSPEPAEGISELPSGYTGFELTTTYNEKTWYLTQISTTDTNGLILWEGLTQEEYVVVELQPPPGYFDPPESTKRTLVQRSVSDDLRITYMTISNTPGFEMPSTGGYGPFVYIFIGGAIMAITGISLIVYQTKRKEERVTDL